jgi:hypothetical protein
MTPITYHAVVSWRPPDWVATVEGVGTTKARMITKLRAQVSELIAAQHPDQEFTVAWSSEADR